MFFLHKINKLTEPQEIGEKKLKNIPWYLEYWSTKILAFKYDYCDSFLS